MSVSLDIGLQLHCPLPKDLAVYGSIHHTVHSQSAKQPRWLVVQLAAPFTRPTQSSRGLVIWEDGKAAALCHTAIWERKRGRVRRKYNIWRLPAAVQWSGIKETCYLNCKQFFSFTRRGGKVQQAVNPLSLSSSNQSCSLSFLDLSFSFESQTHTRRTFLTL